MGVRLTEGVEFWQGKMMSDASACRYVRYASACRFFLERRSDFY